MRKIIAAIAIATPLAMLPGIAGAKGCLKGAAVGGVVGHVAGHHAVVGAAAGCVIEHHREKMKDKAAKQNSASQNRTAGVATPAPGQLRPLLPSALGRRSSQAVEHREHPRPRGQ